MPKKTDETATQPQPLGGAEEVIAEPISNKEADQMAADSGYVFDIELRYFTQYTEGELLEQGYSKSDVARAKRVLGYANLSMPDKPIKKAVAAPVEDETSG